MATNEGCNDDKNTPYVGSVWVSRRSITQCVSHSGTCINNTSVMMFKKGSFEIGCTVYPVAIKVVSPSLSTAVLSIILSQPPKPAPFDLSLWQYDPRFGDAFWNSSKFGMVNYLLRMMSSWAIVCSVWYLPPMSREVWPLFWFSPVTLLFLICIMQL